MHMRIAVFHELPKGGARRAVNEFALHLRKNHLVDLYIPEERKNKSEEDYYSHIYSYRFRPKQWIGKDWKTRLYKDTTELFLLYRLNKRIAQDIYKKRYDIVFVSSSAYIGSPFILRFLKLPYVFYIHDPNYRLVYDSLIGIPDNIDIFRYSYERINRYIRRILDSQNIRKVILCLSPSRYIASGFEQTYDKKSNVVYLGVDTHFFIPSQKKKDIDIFYIGSYQPVDGYQLLASALQLMRVKAKIKILAFEKEWIDSDEQLLRLYQRAKIVVCCALKEGFGLVPLEAMSCGVPVVAVNEAGYKETVRNNKTGFLIPRDPKVLAKRLDWLLTHDEAREKLGGIAREEMEKKWTWKIRTEELEKTLEEFLKS